MLIDSRPTAATSSPPSSNVELPSPAKDPTASQSTKRPPTAPTLRSTLPDPVAALKTFSASNTAVTSAVARAPFLSSGKNTMPTPSDDGYGSHRSPLYLSPNQNAVSPPVNASDSVDTPGTLQIAVPVESSPLKNGSTNPLSPRESVCGARVGTSGSPTTKFSQDVLSARAQTSSVMTKPSTRLSDQAASQALRTPKMDLEESSAVSAGGHEGMPPKAPAPQAVHAYPVPLHHPQHRRRLGSTAEEHSPNHRSPRVLERSPQSSAFGQAADTTEDEVESILPLPPAILETPPPSTAQPSSAAPDQLQFVTSSGQEASDEDSRNNSFMLQSVNTNDPTSHLPPHVTTVRQGSGRGNSAADSSAHPSATEERSPRNAHAPIMRDCPAPQGANGPVRPFSSGKGSSVLGAQSSSNFPSTGVATSASSMNRPGSARSWGRAPSALPSTQESGPLDDVEVRPHPPDVPPVPLAPAQSAAMASATVPVRSSPTTSPVLPVHSTPASGTFPAPSSTASSLAVTLPPALAPVPSAPIHVAHEHSPPQIFSNNSSIGSLAATGGQFFLNGTMTVNPPQEGDHHDESDDEFDDMDSSPSSADGEDANIPPTIPFGSQHSNSSFRSSRISSHAGNSIIAGERRGLSASETERPFTLDNRYQNNSFQPALCRVADNSQGGHQLVPNISGEMQDVVKSPTTPSFNKVPAGGEMPFSLWVPHAVECKEAKAPSQVHKALIEDEPSRLFGYTHNQLRVALSVWHMVMFAFCIACFLVTHVLSTGPDEWMAKLSSDRDYLNNLTYAFVIDSLLLTCPVTFVAFFWGFYLYRRRQETRQKRNWGMDHYYEMIQQAHDRGNNSHSCHPRQNSLSRSNLPPNRRQSVHYNGIHNNAENYAVSPLQIIHANRLYFQDDGRFECQCCTGRLCTRYFPLCRLINFWITVCRGFYFVMCAAVLITHLTLGFQIILNLLFAQPSLSAWEVTMSSGTTFACMEVEIQRSCSGWKTLCNATHYESQEQAHQLLCPYCPSLQRAISKFTTTCYDEFDSTRNTNIAAYLVMGITNFVFLVGGFVGTLVTLNFEVWK